MPLRASWIRWASTLSSAAVFAGCNDMNGAATAVTLKLYSVDGVAVPAPMISSRGRPATIVSGFLQGNNWGHACGFSAGLGEGPLTFAEISECRLSPGEERTFAVTFLDSRFPSGEHTYRFVPE